MAYVWFRYEWQFARELHRGAVPRLHHDRRTVLAARLQFDLTTVAAVLTIAGFSVNDTVVIYDRIREELRRYKKMPLPRAAQHVDQPHAVAHDHDQRASPSCRWSRSSSSAARCCSGFSPAMIWGIIVGTYSTIFVAAPMLIYMNLRREPVACAMKPRCREGAQRRLSAASGPDAAHSRRPTDRRVLRRRAVPGDRRAS